MAIKLKTVSTNNKNKYQLGQPTLQLRLKVVN